jgi:hypothetical protein
MLVAVMHRKSLSAKVKDRLRDLEVDALTAIKSTFKIK